MNCSNVEKREAKKAKLDKYLYADRKSSFTTDWVQKTIWQLILSLSQDLP